MCVNICRQLSPGLRDLLIFQHE
jgi:hypothetical protein